MKKQENQNELVDSLYKEMELIRKGQGEFSLLENRYHSLANRIIEGFEKKLLSDEELGPILKDYYYLGKEKGYKPVHFAI